MTHSAYDEYINYNVYTGECKVLITDHTSLSADGSRCFAGLEEFLTAPTPLSCTADFFQECSTVKIERPEESVEVIECLPFTTPFDVEINHRMCFRTCAFENGPFTDCARCLSDETMDGALPATVNENFYTAYRLLSPGFGTYEPNSICNYRVQCEPGQSLFYTILRHQLQSPEQDLCPDVLRVSNSNGPPLRTCGDLEPSADEASGQTLQNLFVEFQTNGVEELEGFSMIAFCVNDEFQDRDDCSVTGISKRAADTRGKRSFRVSSIKVKPGQVVRYKDYTITVESISEGRLLHRFQNILVLQVYNQFEKFVTFRRSAMGREFPGFGELHIGNGIMHYIQTDINPNFLLSVEEIAIINQLLSNLTRLRFFEKEKFGLPLPKYYAPRLPGFNHSPADCDAIKDSNLGLMNLAEGVRDNCRAFLAAAAEFFLQVVEEQCPMPP